MEGQRIKVFKVFFAWQEEQEAQWLNEMSRNGWHVENYFPAFYTFVKGEPKNYVYKFDYKSSSNRDMVDYVTIFEDAGWEHILQFLGWHYFRTEASEGESPDIYTDNASRLQKYRGLDWVLTIVLLTNVPLYINSMLHANIDSGFAMFTHSFHTAGIALVAYAKYRIYKTMRKLSQSL